MKIFSKYVDFDEHAVFWVFEGYFFELFSLLNLFIKELDQTEFS